VVRGVATAAYAGAITAAAVERNREAGREIATVAGIPDGVCLGAIAAGIVMIPIVGADDAKKGSPAVRHTIGAVVWVAGLVAGGVVGARVAHSLAASPDARVPVTAVGLASTYLTTLVMTLDW
jgi:hypothetical protein